MGGFLRRWLVTFIAVLVAAFVFRLVYPLDLASLAIFALILALLNAIVRPILMILALPLTILTLGLFILVINAIMFWLATVIFPSVAVQGFFGAFLAALVVSIVSYIVNRLFR